MKKISSVLLPLALLATSQASSATLAGDTVDAFISVDYGFGPERKSGFGLDGPFVVADGTADTKQYSSAFTLNVDGDGFNIQFLILGRWAPGTTFTLNDFDFFSSEPVSLSGLNINTSLAGYSTEIGSDYIRLNLGDVYIGPDKYFQATFVTSPVPEPSTLVFSAIALAGVATQVHRKRSRVS